MESHAPREGTSDVQALHEALVDKLKRAGNITALPVEAAFRAVPRHLFLPDVALDKVYNDEAIPTKHQDGVAISSSSQPAIMAIMLEQLGLEPGHRVLEIGAGTGYNAALMAHIVGDTGQVITVDIDQDIVDTARKHLAAAGFERVQVVCGDGGFGHPEAAPYDRIILTVGSPDIAPAWREQLKPGGRLVLPLSLGARQETIAFERIDDYLVSISRQGCGFMMLRGAFAAPETHMKLGPEPGLGLIVDDHSLSLVDADIVYESLAGSSSDRPAALEVTQPELWRGVAPWLFWHEPGFCVLGAEGEPASRGIVPFLLGRPGKSYGTFGLLSAASLALLMLPPDRVPPVEATDAAPPPPTEPPDPPPSFELLVRSFGPDVGLAERMIEQIRAWDAAGRPDEEQLRIRVNGHDSAYVPSASESVVEKRWTRIVLNWQP
ncbi:MAG: methyltransferase, FxLD system [Chloroflexota bacterium]|nr:methyltransferase, FxLD system [Chloroflexota bacterium]